MNAEMNHTKIELKKLHLLGRAMMLVTQQFTSGLINIMKSQVNAIIAVSQKLLNGLMFQVSIIAREMIGLDYVSLATSTMTDTTKRLDATNDPKYVDVIRKRYSKLISPETWEDEWEQLTPKIQ